LIRTKPYEAYETNLADLPLAVDDLGSVDEKVGEIAGCEFWMDREQFKRWAHRRWTVDVVRGCGASFSLEAPLNLRFLIRSSLCMTAPGETQTQVPGGENPV